MRSQREITLKNDLDARERLDIYRNFLLYCMSGDVVALPMGSTGAAHLSEPYLQPALQVIFQRLAFRALVAAVPVNFSRYSKL